MIKNQKQYEYTQELIKSFESSLSAARNPEESPGNKDLLQKLERESLPSYLDALKTELVEYEILINRRDYHPPVLKLSDIKHLAEIPIKACIAANLTQKQLAELAGLTEA